MNGLASTFPTAGAMLGSATLGSALGATEVDTIGAWVSCMTGEIVGIPTGADDVCTELGALVGTLTTVGVAVGDIVTLFEVGARVLPTVVGVEVKTDMLLGAREGKSATPIAVGVAVTLGNTIGATEGTGANLLGSVVGVFDGDTTGWADGLPAGASVS